MLIEDFLKYCENKPGSQEEFDVFFQEHCFGKTFFEMIAMIGWEVYQLQMCMEGLIEDQEYKL
jgi:hypothetical protein